MAVALGHGVGSRGVVSARVLMAVDGIRGLFSLSASPFFFLLLFFPFFLPVVLLSVLAFSSPAAACTSLMVTRGASADGSVMITYTCDGEFHPHLERMDAAEHAPGDSLELRSWSGAVRGKIAQAASTYAVVDMINEHQVAIGETTFDGRAELQNSEGLLHYWDLISLALQRARTAREAVDVMTSLVSEYGYRSTGESFSIADPNEIWYLEMIGPGPGGAGAHWVARRVPDGMICAHANQARIGEFPLDDPANCLYSPDVIGFAIEQGFFDPAAGRPFRFCDAYSPETPESQRYAGGRVWSLLRRAAPSREFSPAYFRGEPDAERYPLWIEPDEKLSLGDVFDLMRDHFEGTPFDMTLGVDAGPYGTPYRWRPLYWEVDERKHMWERPISTQQTGFSFVSQSRGWLPDPVGGVLWYGVDDTYFTCYTPLYCCIQDLPVSYTRGTLQRFSWDSAWWVFNFVSNIANLRYADMIVDIQAVQKELETSALLLQPAVEQTARALCESAPEQAVAYLTHYSVAQAEAVVARWKRLGEDLLTKYNDGYIKDEEGSPQQVGYPDTWLEQVQRARPQQFLVPEKRTDAPDSRLVD